MNCNDFYQWEFSEICLLLLLLVLFYDIEKYKLSMSDATVYVKKRFTLIYILRSYNILCIV